jgi:hypothetical protein
MTAASFTEPSIVVPPARLEELRRARDLARVVRSTIVGSTLPPEQPICRACGRLLGLGHWHGGAA